MLNDFFVVFLQNKVSRIDRTPSIIGLFALSMFTHTIVVMMFGVVKHFVHSITQLPRTAPQHHNQTTIFGCSMSSPKKKLCALRGGTNVNSTKLICCSCLVCVSVSNTPESFGTRLPSMLRKQENTDNAHHQHYHGPFLQFVCRVKLLFFFWPHRLAFQTESKED